VARCPANRRLGDLLNGQLDPAESTDLEAHLETCPACQAALARLTEDAAVGQWRQVIRADTATPAPVSDPPESFLQGLKKELRARGATFLIPPRPANDYDESWPGDRGPAEMAVPPAHVGPYTIVREVGRGGMGVVYEAYDERLKRPAAVKMMLAAAYARPECRQRFHQEAEAAARLQHPHIVPVYEVGEHDGKPFFALEFVEGLTLQAYAQHNPCPPREAAELVRQLATAIQHAHERGVVHRDLKPSNILLQKSEIRKPKSQTNSKNQDPKFKTSDMAVSDLRPSDFEFVSDFGFRISDFVPKVTDFGLAKHLTSPGDVTRSGDFVGTPNYMAPEQAAGRHREVGPAADIYALGAILYELLTGRPPFQGVHPLHTLLQAQTCDPVPARRLQPELPRDLETVCLKCLEKEPARRYATAADLAEDLRRFLVGEPIRARPTGTREQIWKWARRHPAAALLAGVSLAAVLTLAGVVAAYTSRLRAARDRAEAHARAEHVQRERTRKALDAMSSHLVADWLSSQPVLTPAHRDYLRDVLQSYEEFAADTGQDEASRAGVAAAYARVGQIQARLGQLAAAEAAWRASSNRYALLAAEFPAVVGYRQRLANAHAQLGRVYQDLGRRAEAEAEVRKALPLVASLEATIPGIPDFRRELAQAHDTLGSLLGSQGRGAEAVAEFQQAQRLQEQLVAAFPRNGLYRWELAKTCNNLAMGLHGLGKPAKAEAKFRQAHELFSRLADDQPAVPQLREDLATSATNLGRILHTTQRPAEAEPILRLALAAWAQLASVFPGVPTYRERLAGCHTNLGTVLGQLKRPDAAAEHQRQARTLYERLAADFPGVTAYAVGLAGNCCNLGHLERNQGHLEAALPLYTQAVMALENVLAKDPRQAAAREFLRNARWGRAVLFGRLGRNVEAAREWDQVLELEDGPNRTPFRLQRALAWARAGNDVRAGSEVEELAAQKDLRIEYVYELARVCALVAAAVPEDPEPREAFAARAIRLLERARAGGFFRTADRVAQFQKDADFRALRARPEYGRLVEALASP
jgi:serine/threonine protein kinase